jgi:hypothetical protein
MPWRLRVQPESWTWADVEGDVKPRTDTVDLCLDGTVQRRLEEARKRLRLAKADDALDVDTSTLKDEVEALEQEAEAASRTFDVVACGHRRWRELLTEHRSKNPDERYDAATFVPAAIAECVPQFTSPEQVVKAQEQLTTGQITKLFVTVRTVNEGDDTVPLTRGR